MGGQRDIFFALDAESHELMRLAEVLCTTWPELSMQVGDYGPILDFQGVWMRHRNAGHGLWAPAAAHFMRRTLRKYSVMVLNAFPLEYEGRLPDRSPLLPEFQRRRRAMIRYYGRVLGVSPLPFGDGWMWAPRPDLASVIKCQY